MIFTGEAFLRCLREHKSMKITKRLQFLKQLDLEREKLTNLFINTMDTLNGRALV